MCCGQGTSNKQTAKIIIQAAQSKAVAPTPVAVKQPQPNPFVIPKATKDQLIINAQLARIPKKT
jgi:hypothetical protein